MKFYHSWILLVLANLFSNKAISQDFNYRQYFNDTVNKPSVVIDTISNQVVINRSVDLEKDLELHNKVFKKNTYFNDTSIPVAAIFYSSQFYENVYFSKSKFSGYVDLSNVEFKKEVNFTGATLGKIIFMSLLSLDSTSRFEFYRANLPDLVDFSFNKNIVRNVDFTNANFDNETDTSSFHGKHFINLYNSDVNKIKLDYIHFRLCFYDIFHQDQTVFSFIESIRARRLANGESASDSTIFKALIKSNEFKQYISEIFPTADPDDSVVNNFAYFYFFYVKGRFPGRLSQDQIMGLYLKLLKNFESSGQKISYRLLDIDYQNYVNGWFNISNFWYCYGYHKERIFYWTMGLLIIFTLINYKCYNALLGNLDSKERVYKIDDIPNISIADENYTLKKLKYAFVFTSIVFFSFALKTEHLNFKKPAFFYIVVINVVGLLCLGYLANFILQK